MSRIKKRTTREQYTKKDPWLRNIINMHHKGKAPSEIDRVLNLEAGTAKDEILKYWDACM